MSSYKCQMCGRSDFTSQWRYGLCEKCHRKSSNVPDAQVSVEGCLIAIPCIALVIMLGAVVIRTAWNILTG